MVKSLRLHHFCSPYVYINIITMIFTNYTKTDTYYQFTTNDGKELLVPVESVILVDDESGAIAVKNTASRCNVGIIAE